MDINIGHSGRLRAMTIGEQIFRINYYGLSG